MPSRAPCATYSYSSFGKLPPCEGGSRKSTTRSDPIYEEYDNFSDLEQNNNSRDIYSKCDFDKSPFSKSDSKRRSFKSVRFADDQKPVVDDENSVNERLEADKNKETTEMSAADVMADALYATVRKRSSPAKERFCQPSMVLPQVLVYIFDIIILNVKQEKRSKSFE